MHFLLERFVAKSRHRQRMAWRPRVRGCVLAIDADAVTS
jgi:hypothetical protein